MESTFGEAVSKELQLWVIPASTLTALWVAATMYARLKPEVRERSPPSAQLHWWLFDRRAARAIVQKAKRGSPRRRRQTRNEFTFAVSKLDTHGNLVTSWQMATPPSMGSQDMVGWMNLVVVLIVGWVLRNAIVSWKAIGHVFIDQGVWASAAFHVPELLVAWLVEVTYFFVATYAIMKGVVSGWIGSTAEIILQAVAEIFMLMGPIVYIRHQVHWPVTQRLALGMETAVLMFKMHSYITSNRHLRREVEAGGPGTGASVWRLQDQLDHAQREFAARAGATTTDKAGVSSEDSQEDATDTSSESSPLLTAATSLPAHPATTTALQDAVSTTSSNSDSAATPPGSQVLPGRQNAQALDASKDTPGAEGQSWLGTLNHCFSQMTSLLRRDSHFDVAEQHEVADNRVLARALSLGRRARRNELAAPAAADRSRSAEGRMAARRDEQSTGEASAEQPRRSRHFHIEPIRMNAVKLRDTVLWSLNAEGRPTATGMVAYPNNVHFRDLFGFACIPTLVYEPNYPRTQEFRIGYVIEKALMAATLVIAGSHIMTTQINPALARIPTDNPFAVLLDLFLPMIMLALIVFWVSFECVLNAVAEFTFFGARDFYGPWWNSTSFAEMSRLWNKPVHELLLRHVYLDARRHPGVSATAATYLTFAVSIVLHEVILWAAVTPASPPPYLGILSCFQAPLFTLLRQPFLRHTTLGNILFWSSLIVGISFVFLLYARSYCAVVPEACMVPT